VQRDLVPGRTTFLVIGAGISRHHRQETARRGLRVVDRRGDIGAAITNSLKTIHGAPLVAARGPEQMRVHPRAPPLLRIAPHRCVRCLRHPTSRRHPVRNSAAADRAAAQRLIASDRGGLLPSHRLGGGRLRTPNSASSPLTSIRAPPAARRGGMGNAELRRQPGLRAVGGRMGGVVITMSAPTGCSCATSRVDGARVRDVPSGDTFDIAPASP
jgi:hypothetical protein